MIAIWLLYKFIIIIIIFTKLFSHVKCATDRTELPNRTQNPSKIPKSEIPICSTIYFEHFTVGMRPSTSALNIYVNKSP